MASAAENEQPTSINHRFLEPFDFSHIETLHIDRIQLVWVDQRWQDDDLHTLLNEINPSTRFFDNFTHAIEYLSNNKDSFQFLIIVSGEFSEAMLQLSEHLSQIYCVFIYCLDVPKYQHLKERSLKLLKICDRRSELINSIQDLQASVSIRIAKQYSMRNLNKDPATFIWFQLLNSLIGRLTTDNGEAMDDLKKVVKDYYYDDKRRPIKILDKLANYVPDDAIRLYTEQASISMIINEALRQQDIDLLYKYRHFIRDLSQALTQSKLSLSDTLRVYRGTVFSRENFNKLKHVARRGNFVSTFGYLSTSKDRGVAEMFADNKSTGIDKSSVSVILEIDVDKNISVIAADISSYSKFSQEEEILFDIDSTFEILEVNIDEETQSCIIHMKTSTHGSDLANEYLAYNEKELDHLSVEILFGRLMTNMGEFEKSIKYFERLIDRDNIDQINVRIHWGRAYTFDGDYDNAKKYFSEASNLETNKNSIKMAEIIYNLGLLDNTLGDYNSAIEKYTESLALYNINQSSGMWQIKADIHTNIAIAQTSLSHFDEARQELDSSYECMRAAGLPRNHPDYSQHEISLGKIWQSRGDYDKAEAHYLTALEVRKSTLPPGHLDIGQVLYRLGSVVGEVGNDYEKALTYLHESLVINENAVGVEHPATVLVWSGIANVYLLQNRFEEALKYQLKTLELYQDIYDNKDHEDTARVLNNTGELYRRKKG